MTLGISDGLTLVLIGVAASLAAGIATGLGALPILLFRQPSLGLQDSLLGFAAGLTLALAIGLQNAPEGFAVAAELVREGYPSGKAFLVALLSGLAEPVGALLGLAVVELIPALLPLGMAFAAGAMLFVISDEIIPETHRRGFERTATFSLVVGFVLMMCLDTALG